MVTFKDSVLTLSDDELKVVVLLLNQVRLGDAHPCSKAAENILDTLETSQKFLYPSIIEQIIESTTFDIVLEHDDIEVVRVTGDDAIIEIYDLVG